MLHKEGLRGNADGCCARYFFHVERCTEMGTVRLPMHADGTIIFYRACRRMVATERLIAARL